MRLITVIFERGVVSPNMVVYGLSESLLTPVAGMFVLVISAFLWFFLRVGLWSVDRRR
jgi:biopolymer transport protein ExbB/TolQ